MGQSSIRVARGRRGFSFMEIALALVIFTIAALPLWQVLSTGMRATERTRDHMIAYAVAEKIQEEIGEMLHDEARRKDAIEFQTASPEPLPNVPFFPELKKSVEAAVQAAPTAKIGDAALATQALGGFRYSVKSRVSQPAGAPMPTWMAKDIEISWKDGRGKDKSIALTATFANSDIYHQVVKESYRNAQSVTDQLMQNIANRRNQPLVKFDKEKLAKELTTPMKSNEFVDPDPWYQGYLAQAPGLTIPRRLGTEGQTSDERMAVKEAALAQFFNLTPEQARIRTYDLKNEAEEVVKKIENLPEYSLDFAELKGVEGMGVRSPGKPGAYTCLNCHSPQFLATIDEGFLSIPKEFLAFKGPDGTTGLEWLETYLKILKEAKGISDAEYNKFLNNLKSPDVGIFAGAGSSPRS